MIRNPGTGIWHKLECGCRGFEQNGLIVEFLAGCDIIRWLQPDDGNKVQEHFGLAEPEHDPYQLQSGETSALNDRSHP